MNLAYYVDLLGDPVRIDGFREALKEVVVPGERVLEVGTGLGTFAMFAAEAGAGHVWAVDRDPVIHLAESIARVNGLADRITWLRGSVPDIPLKEKADLVLFEDFAIRFLDERVWRLVRDTASRYLAEGGRFFPARATLRLAPVSGEHVAKLFRFPADSDWKGLGLDWSALEAYLENLPRTANLRASSMCHGEPAAAQVSVVPVPSVGELSICGAWTFDRPVTVRGLAMWFDLDLGQERRYRNGPGSEDPAWGQTVLPIHPPLEIGAGEEMEAEVAPERLSDGAPGWLRWFVRSGKQRRTGHEFAAQPASLQDLIGEKSGLGADPSVV